MGTPSLERSAPTTNSGVTVPATGQNAPTYTPLPPPPMGGDGELLKSLSERVGNIRQKTASSQDPVVIAPGIGRGGGHFAESIFRTENALAAEVLLCTPGALPPDSPTYVGHYIRGQQEGARKAYELAVKESGGQLNPLIDHVYGRTDQTIPVFFGEAASNNPNLRESPNKLEALKFADKKFQEFEVSLKGKDLKSLKPEELQKFLENPQFKAFIATYLKQNNNQSNETLSRALIDRINQPAFKREEFLAQFGIFYRQNIVGAIRDIYDLQIKGVKDSVKSREQVSAYIALLGKAAPYYVAMGLSHDPKDQKDKQAFTYFKKLVDDFKIASLSEQLTTYLNQIKGYLKDVSPKVLGTNVQEVGKGTPIIAQKGKSSYTIFPSVAS
jgi:hypothetical protein